ncbi:Syntaxin-5 [Gryllus bimaculatus]|nr:Syntaxin-5 [Gryllus bimaculatus]
MVIANIKLEKLTFMSKQKSLFNDRPLEVENLIYMIKGDIEDLIQQTARLQNEMQHSYSPKRNKNFNTHCSNIVSILQTRLTSLSREFRHVLEMRNENQKQLIARRDNFQEKPLSSSFPLFNTAGIHGSVLLGDEHVAINMNVDNQRQVLLNDDSNHYIESRRDTMQNIESTIVELGKMFQNLAIMVKEHEEVIKRIDSNLEDTELNIESAQGEILNYKLGKVLYLEP